MISAYCAALLALTLVPSAALAQNARSFESWTVMERGESSFGASAMYGSIDISNSQYFLLASGLDGSGSMLNAGFSYGRAFRDNSVIGARVSYGMISADVAHVNLGLLSEDLSFDIGGVSLSGSSFGTSLFHRRYFGLERSGTVGMFFEYSLDWTRGRMSSGSAETGVSNSIRASFSPGILVYVLPFVSLDVSLGLADFGYAVAEQKRDGAVCGFYDCWEGGLRLNVLNLRFEVALHF